MVIFFLVLSLLIGYATSTVLMRSLSYAAEKKKVIYSVGIGLNLLAGILLYVSGFYANISDKMYNGCYITEATYYEPWDEQVEHTREVEDGTDSDGNTRYRKETYYERVYHAESFMYKLNSGESETVCSKDEFNKIVVRLAVSPKFVDMNRQYYSKDGDAYRYHWDGDSAHCYTVTEMKRYLNYLKGSDNSIFKHHIDEKTKDTYKLFDYPKFSLMNDQITIQGYKCTAKEIREVQLLNAYMGVPKQFRLYLLFYENPDVRTGEMQKSLWEGGKQNEFVVCLGHEGDSITWCYPFSWSDSPKLESMTKMYFLDHPHIDIEKYVEYLWENIDSWEPKNFEEFNYLSNSMGIGPSLRFLLILALINLVVGVIMIKRDQSKRKKNFNMNF